jgi:hypothetical protein
LNRPSILAVWNDGEAGGLGPISARAKTLRIELPRAVIFLAGLSERLAGHLPVRRKGHFKLDTARARGGERLSVKKVVWMSLGAMGPAAKAALAMRSMHATAPLELPYATSSDGKISSLVLMLAKVSKQQSHFQQLQT